MVWVPSGKPATPVEDGYSCIRKWHREMDDNAHCTGSGVVSGVLGKDYCVARLGSDLLNAY
ncbi:hypothetical protein BTUL_0001g00940 [Botrytis tulipae]|uniref:Uncharacterized protein n=1 Tax=Botrytis tulipae TaxID=87230 RepID=A0A4Z1F740_9HELO|nr:hypothetical protein BTUL_0001g00940 [Botrytis tulipae]